MIRLEKKEEHQKVENLVRESFWNVYRPGCLEHYVLHQLRNDLAFVPELDFVMFLNENGKEDKLIGQNMFMRTAIKSDDGRNIPIMTMGPICITPELKRQGYGKALLDYSLDKAAKLGCGAVCFEGNIDFYGKSGFRPASEFNIRYHGLEEGQDASFFLCKELIPGYLNGITGEYATPAGYFVDEKKVCEDIILIVAIDEKKRLVTIRYKKLTGDIVEQTLLFEEYADDFLSESIQKHLVRFDIFDIVKQTGQVDRKEIREHWENAKLSFWEQRKCMKKVMNMEKVLGEWFVVFQNAVSYLAEKGVMNQSPLVQSDYELFSCESKNLGKKLKRYCEILSNASDYIMGEEK